jgi:hypothetical protein
MFLPRAKRHADHFDSVECAVAGSYPRERAARIALLDRYDMTDRRERAERTESTAPLEPIENAERKDPMEPMEQAEPIEPIDRMDPLDPMESTESSDQSDQRDVGTVPLLTTPSCPGGSVGDRPHQLRSPILTIPAEPDQFYSDERNCPAFLRFPAYGDGGGRPQELAADTRRTRGGLREFLER